MISSKRERDNNDAAAHKCCYYSFILRSMYIVIHRYRNNQPTNQPRNKLGLVSQRPEKFTSDSRWTKRPTRGPFVRPRLTRMDLYWGIRPKKLGYSSRRSAEYLREPISDRDSQSGGGGNGRWLWESRVTETPGHKFSSHAHPNGIHGQGPAGARCGRANSVARETGE